MDGRTNGQTDGHTDGKSPYSTVLCLLSGPLPCYSPTLAQRLYKRGKGTADHMMPLGAWFTPSHLYLLQGNDTQELLNIQTLLSMNSIEKAIVTR